MANFKEHCVLLLFSLSLIDPLFLLAQSGSPSPFLTIVPLPSPINNIVRKARVFNKNLGYAFTDEKLIFKYENGSWQQIPFPFAGTIETIYFTHPHQFWVVYYPPKEKEQFLARFKQGRWKSYNPPNVDHIAYIEFENEDEGWAFCHWGEILRFENETWRHIYSPTRCHIINAGKDPDTGKIYAWTDCRKIMQILQYKDGQWIILDTLTVYLSTKIALLPGHRFMAIKHGESYLIRDGHIYKTSFPVLWNAQWLSDGSGYAIGPEGIYQLQDTTLQLLAKTETIVLSGISVAEDGTLWIYDGAPGLWRLGPAQPLQPPDLRGFSLTFFNPGNIMGIGILAVKPTTYRFYLVEHLTHNLILQIHNDRLSWEIYPASKLGLNEPQRNSVGEPVYDLGVLVADFDQDGLEDVFVTSLYGRNAFFLNMGNSRYKEIFFWTGMENSPMNRYTIAAAADIDNDGDLDLCLPNEWGRTHLYINNGLGRFRDESESRGIILPPGGKAAAFADIDMDGWIDVAITTFGEGTFLFRNKGNGYFEDITPSNPILQANKPEKVSSLTFADYDNDGDFDLFLSKLGTRNQLLRNAGSGIFEDVTREVGLKDQDFSRGALFFDMDNDGDLDLFVTNFGVDRLYENLGGFFYERADYLSNRSIRIRTPQGGVEVGPQSDNFSAGAVLVDIMNNGVLDLIVAGYNTASYWLRKDYKAAPKNFLGFELKAYQSNRSAIGAVVKLYPHGELGNEKALIGMRMVPSTSSYASHSQKILHFGVDPDSTYDARIFFPGGRQIEITDLSPGRYYQVEELTGLQKLSAVAKWRIKKLIFGYRGRLTVIQFLALLAFVLFVLKLRSHKAPWLLDENTRYVTAIAFVIGFLIIRASFYFQNNGIFFMAPLTAGAMLAFFAAFLYRQWRLYHSPHASIENLSMQLAGFSHSQSAANILGSFEFQLNNFPTDLNIDFEVKQHILKTIKNIKETIFPEFDFITEQLLSLRLDHRTSHEFIRSTRKFKKITVKFERAIRHPRRLNQNLLYKTRKVVTRHITIIKNLREFIRSKESCELVTAIEKVLQHYDSSQAKIVWHPPQDPVVANIAPMEFHRIFDEVMTNAVRAMETAQHKCIEIAITIHEELIEVTVKDTGTGIPPELWEVIFSRFYSSRKGGGLGLYYARRALERYQGKIFVKDSLIDKGTTIAIQLQKFEPKRRSEHHEPKKTSPGH